MFGFETPFDLNKDGKLGSFEKATEFMIFQKVMGAEDDDREDSDETESWDEDVDWSE